MNRPASGGGERPRSRRKLFFSIPTLLARARPSRIGAERVPTMNIEQTVHLQPNQHNHKLAHQHYNQEQQFMHISRQDDELTKQQQQQQQFCQQMGTQVIGSQLLVGQSAMSQTSSSSSNNNTNSSSNNNAHTGSSSSPSSTSSQVGNNLGKCQVRRVGREA